MAEDATSTVDAASLPGDTTASADAGGTAPDGKIVAFDVDKWKVSDKRFPLGVQAGAMHFDSAVLWCRFGGPQPALKRMYA